MRRVKHMPRPCGALNHHLARAGTLATDIAAAARDGVERAGPIEARRVVPRRLAAYLKKHSDVSIEDVSVHWLDIVPKESAHDTEVQWTKWAFAGHPAGFNGFRVYGGPGRNRAFWACARRGRGRGRA